MSRPDDFVILALFGLCGFDDRIPKWRGIHSKHIALELGHCSRSGHGLAEVDIFLAIDSQHSDDEWHLRGGKVFAHVADEVCQEAGVFTIIAIRIRSPIDQVVKALQPYKSRKFVALLGIVGGTDSLRIRQHPFSHAQPSFGKIHLRLHPCHPAIFSVPQV